MLSRFLWRQHTRGMLISEVNVMIHLHLLQSNFDLLARLYQNIYHKTVIDFIPFLLETCF